MSDILDDAVERLEWDERKEEDTPVKRWRQLTRRTALTRWRSRHRGDDPRGVRQ